ncbi:MAG: SRPBCC family protein [Candidatus Protochlamydia sp.]|nr:SRPBCC family protein [Candidatus Protochlamydia sp.]
MYKLKYLQKIPLSVDESWEFFSSPENLKTLTPEKLRFTIKGDAENRSMYSGQIIAYTIRPIFNFPLEWITEITHVEKPHYFIDEQRFGSYKFWHHEHRFNPIEGGVEIVDTIYYKLPFGPFGKILNSLKIKPDIEEIFTYRRKKMENLFGSYG